MLSSLLAYVHNIFLQPFVFLWCHLLVLLFHFWFYLFGSFLLLSWWVWLKACQSCLYLRFFLFLRYDSDAMNFLVWIGSFTVSFAFLSRSLPRGTNPRFSSGNSSPLCLPLTECEWRNKMLCFGFLRGCLCLQQTPSVRGRQNLHCFSQLDVIWVPLAALMLWTKDHSFGFRPHVLTGNPHCSWDISLEPQLLPRWEEPALFTSLSFLWVSMWHLL